MSDDNRIRLTDDQPTDSLMRSLSDIVNDLWGNLQSEVKPHQADTVAPEQPAATPQTAQQAKPQPAPEKEEDGLPPFDEMWQLADETVDWTEVLVHDKPEEGMSRSMWQLLHRNAEAVLRGDTAAYIEVLRQANPLSDLQPWADAIEASIVSADAITATFWTMKEEPEDLERYMAGMALRIARDLFALLPVSDVTVVGIRHDEELLRVTFRREQLRKIVYAFADPADLVRKSGGTLKVN